MKIKIQVTVLKSNSGYNDPHIKKEITIDVPGSDFESLNLPQYIQTTLETSIAEFMQLPEKGEEADDNKIPF